MADVVVMASGSGTNFEAIAAALAGSSHRVSLLICDRPDAYALVRAERRNIPSAVVTYSRSADAAEERIATLLEEHQPALVALAGYMRILSPRIVDLLPGSIINVHPSILPSFPGTDAIRRSFDSGGPMGVTVHRIDYGVDTGPVLAQREIDRSGLSSIEEAQERIHALEHQLYPQVVNDLLASWSEEPSA